MEFNFKEKVALVTGAGGAIGSGIAKALAKYGAKVFALDYSKESLDRVVESSANIIPVCVDLTNWDATRSTIAELGQVDLLVNGAGIVFKELFMEITPEKLKRTMDVNVMSMFNVSQIVAEGMKKAGKKGAIVNISSDASITAVKETASYCVSKAAVNMLTRVMAQELGPSNIRVNAVMPTVVEGGIGLGIVNDSEWAQATLAAIPLGRFATVQDVVTATLFLLCDDASMITGALLPVDGGILTA
eukprot:GHVU01120984.1.p1 GENE.GHVU01120984.1~~GHVU01120984.1.p1  ORF type:complete len:245 (+),score=36.51 GHVU01120984.1:93-827(+)